MHHLTAFGGKQPSLFKKAVVQSAAYDVWVDRKNDLEQKFQDLLRIAGCSGKGLECLRALDFTAMKTAQDKYISSQPDGKFGFGPTTDGTFVRQLPALEFASGNYDKNVESLVLSHVADEAGMFVKDPGNNETAFQSLLEFNFGKNPIVNEAMLKHFPPTSKKWTTQKQRFHEFVQTTVFTCNVRYMTEAYKGKTFNVQYARGAGTHGSDILPTFFSSPGLLGGSGQSAKLNAQYQSQLISHARSGDVNKFRVNGTIEWPKAEWAPALKQVLNVTDRGFELIADDKTTAEECDFWKDVMAALTVGGGYSPPGAVVESSLLAGKADVIAKASANFQ
jgi:carboxylesterase type B